MAKKTRRGEQVTPERLMELSFAYAPPLIISAGVSNQVFDSLEDGAKTPGQVAEKIFAYTRKRRLSSKQKSRNTRGVLWNHYAADRFTMVTIVRHRPRRPSG